MADPRTSFMILEDSASQAGLPLHKVLEGDAYAAKNALPALVAKSGTTLIYLKVNPSTGALLVDAEGANVECMHAKGELAAGSATMVQVTGAEIILSVDTEYQSVGFLVSCRRDALFQIIQQDDVTDTVIGEIVVGSGAYTVSDEMHCFSFTTGSTGVQKIKIFAKNFDSLSSLRASITVEEIQ